MSRWNRIILLLACCAAFAGCSTQDTTGAVSVDPATCRDTCEDLYNPCLQNCNVDNQICPEECVDTLASCKNRCG